MGNESTIATLIETFSKKDINKLKIILKNTKTSMEIQQIDYEIFSCLSYCTSLQCPYYKCNSSTLDFNEGECPSCIFFESHLILHSKCFHWNTSFQRFYKRLRKGYQKICKRFTFREEYR